MPDHTPTPWTDLKNGDISTHADHERCMAICTERSGATPAEDKANAAIIVKAVNNHAALVEALSAWAVEPCEIDVLNPCLSGWALSKPIQHWGGGKACRVCFGRAVLAKVDK